MYHLVNSTRPLTIKFALLTAACAGFAAPAHAAFISSAPAGFTPVVFSPGAVSTYGLDLNKDGINDFTISNSDGGFASIYGNVIGASVDADFLDANAYANTSFFLSAGAIKAAPFGSLGTQFTAATPFAELVYSNNGVATRGYIQGTTNAASNAFTLSDFGTEVTNNVPEPGSLALLAVGAAGIGAMRRRRSARAI